MPRHRSSRVRGLGDLRSDDPKRKLGNAERDVVALGIAIAAIILFIGTGGSLMPKIMRAWMGTGDAPDLLLTNAVLLNIALLIFGWRRYVELHEEIGERRRAEEAARVLADTDALTGCFNRRSGGPAVDRLCEQAMAAGRNIAVLMIDLDNFKQINDLNGHTMGDQVLQVTAQRIRALLPTDGVLTRLGGDEFVCAFSFEKGSRARVDDMSQRLIDTVSQPVECGGLQVEVTVSIGIATDDASAEGEIVTGEKLIHRADIAMYQAKKRGRNRYFWFEAPMEDKLRFRNELESAIRSALPQGEFVPFYEQQVDLATGELIGFEMLARWNSPRYGMVSPEIFIPIAEDIDLIGDMSERLIKQALADAKGWHSSVSLSVNISPVQLRDPWFAQKILHLLVESGFPANRLELEITETSLHENIGAVRAIMASLKNQGIRISLDDFGTGYSSFAQLRTLPFDRLKIDRSFVKELREGGTSTQLVEAIVRLGKGLSLPITAEGVENEEVLETLRDMGEFKGQGHLYGKPEDAAATRARLAKLNLLAGDNPRSRRTAAPMDTPLRQRAG